MSSTCCTAAQPMSASAGSPGDHEALLHDSGGVGLFYELYQTFVGFGVEDVGQRCGVREDCRCRLLLVIRYRSSSGTT